MVHANTGYSKFRYFFAIFILIGVTLIAIASAVVGEQFFIAVIMAVVICVVLSLFSSSQLAFMAIFFSTLIVYRWDIGLFQLSLYRIFLGLAILRMFIERRRLFVDRMFVLISVLILWDIVGILASENTRSGIQFVVQELEFLLAYFILLNTATNLATINRYLKAFVASTGIAIALGYWQWLNAFVLHRPFQWPLWQYTRLAEDAKWLGVMGAWSVGVERVTSVIGDPANFAILLGLSISIVFGLLIGPSQPRSMSLFLYVYLCLALGILVATGGRIGQASTILSFGIFGLLALQKKWVSVFRRRKLARIAILTIVGAAILLYVSQVFFNYNLVGQVWTRIVGDVLNFGVSSEGYGSSIGRRFYQIKEGLLAWSLSPIWGVGTGGISSRVDVLGVHNTWILRLAQNGVIGFLIVSLITLEIVRIPSQIARKLSVVDKLSLQQYSWTFVFVNILPILVFQLLIAWMFWGYWWQPFYIIVMALIGASYRVIQRIDTVQFAPE